MLEMWSPVYREVDIISRLKGDKYVYCPVVIDDILHIAKAKIIKMERDVYDPHQTGEIDLRCDIELYIKKNIFSIFNYTKIVKIEDINTMYLGKDLIDTLKRVLNIFRESDFFNKVKISKNLEYIIDKENLNEKSIDYKIKINRLNHQLYFNKNNKKKNYNSFSIS